MPITPNPASINAMAAALTASEKAIMAAADFAATALKKLDDMVTANGLNPSSSGAMYFRGSRVIESLGEAMNRASMFHIACQEWRDKYVPGTGGDVVILGGGGGKGGNLAVFTTDDGKTEDKDYAEEYVQP
jgi:hypothetical protein